MGQLVVEETAKRGELQDAQAEEGLKQHDEEEDEWRQEQFMKNSCSLAIAKSYKLILKNKKLLKKNLRNKRRNLFKTTQEISN